LIHAFPKTHMLAAGSIGIILTLILAISPSAKVNATRTSIPLPLTPNGETSNTSESVASVIRQLDESPQTESAKSTTPNENSKHVVTNEHWDTFEIKPGHTLSVLFANAGFNDKIMYQVIGNKNNQELTRIYPGEKIAFQRTANDELSKVKLIRSPLEAHLFVRTDGGSFEASKLNREPEIHVAYGEGVIDSSLFLAGQKAGLSQAQIMELANIFGWDIDFVLDIRAGDRFSLLYEELYLDGEKYKNGRILAASFTNQNRELDAVLYEQPDGISNYYTPDGDSMRKAFIRTPVDFARISSHFDLKRKHPILHKIRAHRGTDYAASYGTPIKAAGDGKIIHAGRKGGYGRTVIIQHGQEITTLYAHMSKYARGIRSGKRVKQGQVIGYIGSSGLASGPHLHYEFRVNGVHKNPVKVRLPHAKPIDRNLLADFKDQTSVYLAQLSTFRESYQLAANN